MHHTKASGRRGLVAGWVERMTAEKSLKSMLLAVFILGSLVIWGWGTLQRFDRLEVRHL